MVGNLFGSTSAPRAGADAASTSRPSSSGCGGARARRTGASSISSPRTCSARWRRWPRGRRGSRCPASCSSFWLVFAGRWRDIYRKLELPRGLVCSSPSGCPWYHAMLIRHGAPFWNEFIGDNYVHRAEGRHGDRGTFEYYLQWIGYGMFPWSGIAAVGAALGFGKLREVARARARRLRAGLVPRRLHHGDAGEHQVPPLHPAGAAGAGDPGGAVPRRLSARADARRSVGAWRSSPLPLTFLRGAIWRRSRRAFCGCSTTTTSTCPAPGGRGRRCRNTATATSTACRSWCSPSRRRSPSPG